MPTYVSEQSFKTSAGDFERLSTILHTIVREIPNRTTTRQVAAFFSLCFLESMGKTITLTELSELAGNDEKGVPVYGTAYDRVLEPFRMPDKKSPDRTGWVTHQEDEDDRRRKILKLTQKGREVAMDIVEHLKGD
jgi:hypothetical protein